MPRVVTKLTTAACLVVALIVATTSAPAQPAPAPPTNRAIADAEARMDRGRMLYDRGDLAGALAEFEQAYALTHAWQVLIFIGVAQSRLFRYAEALESFERYLADGGAAVPEAQRAQVTAEVAAVRAVVAEVEVVIEGASARLWIDDREVGASPFGKPFVVGPGQHRLRAERAGAEPRTETIELVSGERRRVELSLATRTTARATLAIEAHPGAAELFLDGKPLGVGPWRGELTPGGYAVSARLARHRSAVEQVALGDGQDRTVELTLEPLPDRSTPLHRRWQTWAVVGVAVAASATYGVLYATRYQPEVPIAWP